MSKKMVALGLVLVLLTGTMQAFATAGLKEQINKNKQEQKELREDINKKMRELNQLSSVIFDLDSKITSAEARLDNLQLQMKNLNINIKATKAQIEQTEAEIAENEEMLKERIRVMYKTSDLTYFQLLLESSNLSDLISNAYNVQKIVNSDREMLEELEASRKSLEDYKMRLLAEKDRMTAVQEKIKKEQAQYEQNLAAQQNAKNALSKNVQLLKLQEQALQRENSVLEQKYLAAVRASGSNNTPYSGGAFLWPLTIRGTLTSGYGYRSDPFTGVRSFHQGQDIAAPKGTAVLAAANGTVITSRYQNSYGNVIMIDHGGGIATVYAHNSALLVSEGTKVTKGQTIARVGSTGYSTGNHLHFEVRVNGKTVNPMGYYK